MSIIDIIQNVYPTIKTVPGYYIDFAALLNRVNEQLTAQGEKILTADELKDTINIAYPWAKYDANYNYEKGDLHIEIPLAIRINQIQSPNKQLTGEQLEACKNILLPLLDSLEPSEDGWYPMGDIGSIIKRNGISPQQYGYEKLSFLLKPRFK